MTDNPFPAIHTDDPLEAENEAKLLELVRMTLGMKYHGVRKLLLSTCSGFVWSSALEETQSIADIDRRRAMAESRFAYYKALAQSHGVYFL